MAFRAGEEWRGCIASSRSSLTGDTSQIMLSPEVSQFTP